jgi:hypothetical protein
MSGITFEWTFKFGDVFTLIGALVVAASFLYKRGGHDTGTKLTLEAMASELKEMKSEFKEFTAAMTRMAVQETKINLLMKWYDELRRGKGWVTGERGIDREYPDE